jgi:MFS family permease
VAAAPPLRALFTAPVIISVLNYSLLAISEISFTALLPVYLASTPLSLTPRAIGLLIGSKGIFNGIFQSLCTAALVEKWGVKRVHQVSLCAFFPLWALFPIAVSMATTDDSTGSSPWGLWLLIFIGVMLATVMDMSFSKHPCLI